MQNAQHSPRIKRHHPLRTLSVAASTLLVTIVMARIDATTLILPTGDLHDSVESACGVMVAHESARAPAPRTCHEPTLEETSL